MTADGVSGAKPIQLGLFPDGLSAADRSTRSIGVAAVEAALAEPVEIVVTWIGSMPQLAGGSAQRGVVNWSARIADVPVGKACVWLLEGQPNDVGNAKAFMAQEYPLGNWAVFTFPPGVEDSLNQARGHVLAQHGENAQSVGE